MWEGMAQALASALSTISCWLGTLRKFTSASYLWDVSASLGFQAGLPQLQMLIKGQIVGLFLCLLQR